MFNRKSIGNNLIHQKNEYLCSYSNNDFNLVTDYDDSTHVLLMIYTIAQWSKGWHFGPLGSIYNLPYIYRVSTLRLSINK